MNRISMNFPFIEFDSARILCKKVQVDNDQEKAQSEKISLSKNRS